MMLAYEKEVIFSLISERGESMGLVSEEKIQVLGSSYTCDKFGRSDRFEYFIFVIFVFLNNL
jgi:hypothetical protein